jgi:tetratricopeptide (TPR) repeat protein
VHLQRARFYEEASRITRDKRMRAEALLGLGDVAFHFLNDTAAALASYRAVSNENADKELTRRALIGQGDIRLFSGELEAATDLYRRAGVLPEHDKGAEALRTSYGNLIEGYIKMGDFPAARDAISTWEWKYPLIKTEGYSFILRSRIAFAAGDMSEVRKLTTCIIETLVEDSFKPEAFYLLISSLLRQRQVVLAKDFYQILVDRFPRDAYVEMLRSSFR